MQKSLRNVILAGRLIKKLDKKVGELGFQQTMMKVVKHCGNKLIIHHKTKDLDNILKNQPVIVVANHPAEPDFISLIAALSARKDLYIIINSSLMNIGPNLDKHFIPVHINHRLINENKNNFRLNLLLKFHQTEILTGEEAHQKNINSINKASKKIKQGGLVIIFPTGRLEDKWFPGVGYLIKGVGNKKNAVIVKAYIKGSTDWDYLRLIPGLGKIFPAIKIFFSQPKPVNEFIKYHPKEIVHNLESEFNDWIKNLLPNKIIKPSLSSNFSFPKKAYFIVRSLFFWLITKTQ